MNRKTLYTITTIALFAFAAGCGGGKKEEVVKESAPAGGGAAFKVDPATAATITGKVSFTGTAPKKVQIRMDAEPDCMKLHSSPTYSQEVMVNPNGTLADVFVYVKAGLEGKTFEPPTGSVTLDQKGCIYKPHVVGVRAGQTIAISNSDPTTHNIHPMPKVNREWNQSQAATTPSLDKTFARPEIMIPVKCNVHAWMKSYVGVVDHPYFAVTGDQGTFEIKNLPPGEYTLEAWQEKYGPQEQKVTLAASATQTVEFKFKGE